jgi:hypothetical protein
MAGYGAYVNAHSSIEPVYFSLYSREKERNRMKKSSLAALVAVLGLLVVVFSQLLLKINNDSFAFGLSSDFWGGFVISAGVGLMLVLLSVLYSKEIAPIKRL